MHILLALDPVMSARRGVLIDTYHPEQDELAGIGCTIHRVTSREAFLRCCTQGPRRQGSRFDVALSDAMLTGSDHISVAVAYSERLLIQSSIRGFGICVPRRLHGVMPVQTKVRNGHVLVYDDCFRSDGCPNWVRLLTRVCSQLTHT